MRLDSSQVGGSVALRPVQGTAARAQPWRERVSSRMLLGSLALLALVAAATVLVIVASDSPSALVPLSATRFPGWLAGPLQGLFGRLALSPHSVAIGLSLLLGAMTIAYGVTLACARALSARAIVICVIALHAILLLSPPLQLSDLFNYLGYARLGALHHLNPYVHPLLAERHDPVFPFTTWHDWRSPYGPLFTVATYPLALMSVPVAYWVMKVLTVLASLAFLAVLWHCARRFGRDPRLIVLLVVANPIYLVYAIGGFHNDFFMLALSTGAIALVLARRERTAGVALVAAVGVKFTVVLLLPFLLVAAQDWERRKRLLVGAGVAAAALAALSVALFGFTLPNVNGQSDLVTYFSLPNLVGTALGTGGATTTLVHIGEVGVVLVVLVQLKRNRDWLAGAGWSMVALLASLAWLMPWYVVWALPLAALAGSVRLRRTALALSVYVVLSFIPATTMFLSSVHLVPPLGKVGEKALAAQTSAQ